MLTYFLPRLHRQGIDSSRLVSFLNLKLIQWLLLSYTPLPGLITTERTETMDEERSKTFLPTRTTSSPRWPRGS
jgi:hypothetical protein